MDIKNYKFETNFKPVSETKNQTDYNFLYNRLNSLFLEFLDDTYLENVEEEPIEVEDLRTIKRFANTYSIKYINETIEQGYEILSLHNFPDEWISEISNRYCNSQDEYKKWLKWMISVLEHELENKI